MPLGSALRLERSVVPGLQPVTARSARLDAGFDADRAAGKLARLPEIIREARAALRHRPA